MPPRAASLPLPLPAWSIVAAGDPRERAGSVEAPSLVSAEWARTVRAASNRPWTNAAKVIATIAAERPEARYVEGWATKGGVAAPVWHAWVDVPLGTSEHAWMRIDPSPMWRWMLEHNRYAPVLEVRGAALAPLVEPLLRPRGRASCRLPIAPLAPMSKLASFLPEPAPTLGDELGAEVARRTAELRQSLLEQQQELTAMVHTDGQAELDRLAALRVLPHGR